MKKLFIMSMVLIAVLLSGCMQARISLKPNQDADFSDMRTYSWAAKEKAEGADPRTDPSFHEPCIMNAIDAAMADKGYKKVKKNSSFTLGYSVAISEQVRNAQPDDKEAHIPSGFSRRGRYNWKWTPEDEAGLEYYDEGTLCMRAVESKEGYILWQGCASMPVDLAASEKKRRKMIAKIVEALMSEFPE